MSLSRRISTIIERFVRQESNEWLLSEAVGLEASLPIVSVQLVLMLSDVYEAVTIVSQVPPLLGRERGREE